jgi:hypothetical protein|uniref:Uncharacterized protein n=1 Tax=Myoviridae sp. ctB3C22 TaxID=2826629 RepID=A0A8S5QUX2_9CAUD|nr:MAG TPA: hypothetical protein [Myoviridae sp. ctB3C22]
MPIKPSNSFSARIRNEVKERTMAAKAAIATQLFYIGLECLTNARSVHRYKDRTSNLASSINYCVVVDGEIVRAGEWQAIGGNEGDGKEGVSVGMEYLHKVAAEQPKDGKIRFVMVAGMPYAQYVEAMSFDVLDTSEQMAERKIKEMLDNMFKPR